MHLIPLTKSSSTAPPEWAMIEVNGELLAPKESPTEKENWIEEHAQIIELGSIEFVNDVSLLLLFEDDV